MMDKSVVYEIKNFIELEEFLRKITDPNYVSDRNSRNISRDRDSISMFYVNGEHEYFLFEESKVAPYLLAPEISVDLNLTDVKLFLAMYNKYIPVYSKETKQLLFTEEEFLAIRKKMSGLKKYKAGDFIFSDNLSFPGIDELRKKIEQNNERVMSEESKVKDFLKGVLQGLGSVSYELGKGDIELLGTGSTSRGTSVPTSDRTKNGDYDFVLRATKEQMYSIRKAISSKLIFQYARKGEHRFRLYGVRVDGLDKPVDIDISFITTKELYYSTDQALDDRLKTIKEQDEERYHMVVANIVKAKKVLKAAGVYKASRSDRTQAGLGGIGIENWILQYGGSFRDAAIDFLAHAQGKSFIEFEQEYHILDFGNNHVSKSRGNFPYDSFIVRNMREYGFEKMKAALITYLKELELTMDEPDKDTGLKIT